MDCCCCLMLCACLLPGGSNLYLWSVMLSIASMRRSFQSSPAVPPAPSLPPPCLLPAPSLPPSCPLPGPGCSGDELDDDFLPGDDLNAGAKERQRLLLLRVRQVLLHVAASLDLPANPLDDIIERLGGAAKVAEMTGRKSAVVSAHHC